MKSVGIGIFVLLCSICISGCGDDPVTGDPDLIVTEFATTGAPSLQPDNSVQVPTRVTVLNQGDYKAGIFKVAVYYQISGQQDIEAIPFTVPGQDDTFYPWTYNKLEDGEQFTFDGIVTFPQCVRGKAVLFWITADSCEDDVSMPDYCRVEESDETNNNSFIISMKFR